ncbi:MAG: RNA-binding protein [Spirochaetes bacterium GWF1_51_8]|nr:MAG: RNA-binding protein [Spirochaetes bacterium GWF1_51_8]
MPTSIYVGNLPFSTSEQDLASLFAPYGEVVSAKIVVDRETGRSKGFGFVEMGTQDQAQSAIASLDQSEVAGRNIKVNLAKPRKPRF